MELAPQAGFEPATLRLTGSRRWSILLVLVGLARATCAVLSGVREKIVH